MPKSPKVKFMIGAKSGSSESLNSLIPTVQTVNNDIENVTSPESPDSLSKSDLVLR
jgi:hypothetical protein